MKYELLNWDSGFFGYNVAVAKITDPAYEDLEEIITDAFSSGIKLLYIFSTKPISHIDLLEKYHGKLVDKKVIFKKSLSQFNFVKDDNIDEYKENNVSAELKDLAFQSGEYSRFKIDNRLPVQAFEKLYTIWIENSIQGKTADKVYIFNVNGLIAGFITVSIKDNFGEIGLIAVNNDFRGKAIGTKLIQTVENFVFSAKKDLLKVATQLDNQLACKFYEKNGFEIDSITHVYHFFN
jgi:dTDP-4-amino-4,6-dideoxy-D-galactose acyltransferase